MELYLVDINPLLIKAWRSAFAHCPEVQILEADILELAEDTIVSPANSYGFMDGGLDRRYVEFFGFQPQEALQKAILARPEGYLPIGASVLLRTGHSRIHFLIAAPTMITPGAVEPQNCFYATIAVLHAAHRHRSVVKKVFCPGLATGIGQVDPVVAAEEMARAYRRWHQRMRESQAHFRAQ